MKQFEAFYSGVYEPEHSTDEVALFIINAQKDDGLWFQVPVQWRMSTIKAQESNPEKISNLFGQMFENALKTVEAFDKGEIEAT